MRFKPPDKLINLEPATAGFVCVAAVSTAR